MDNISEKMKDDPLKILKGALENVRPVVETKSRRVGGANYQVPVEVRAPRGEALSIRWILTAANARPGKSMMERLSGELMDAYQNVVRLLRREKTFTRWLKQTKLSLTSVGKVELICNILWTEFVILASSLTLMLAKLQLHRTYSLLHG
jgi:ribosomal protein S7